MEPKALCVLVVVFSLALSTLAQSEAGKSALFPLHSRHTGQRWASEGGTVSQ